MLKFYYAPWSRASGVRWLLEELGVPYEKEHIDIRAEGGAPESYRKVQPNKKVPAIAHDGIVVTERAAITMYLADSFPEAKLAPPVGSPERAKFLTMNVYVDSVLDPCVSAKAHGLTYVSNDYSFGMFDALVDYLERELTEHEYAAGSYFTAADTQLGSAISFTMNNISVLPRRPAFEAYLKRIDSRPAYIRAQEDDKAEAMQMPFFQKMFAAQKG